MELQTNRLLVTVREPGADYHGARFDWSGFVAQVRLDGAHTFCVPEQLGGPPRLMGVGLCGEFGIREPLAFDETAVGAQFPKLGVGLLTRPDERPYFLLRPYQVETFPITWSADATTARFVVAPRPCQGYAARLEKTLAVTGAALRVSYTLANVGDRALVTTEYVHNFVGFDDYAAGPDYTLLTAAPLVGPPPPAPLAVDGAAIAWRAAPAADYEWTATLSAAPAQPWWELRHQPSGLWLRETTSFPWQKLNLWGQRHVISPEAFIRVALQPGEQANWWREFTFGHDAV